jgi:hypothetical protein
VLIENMGAEKRSPRFVEFAASHGVESSYSTPMIQDDDVVGVPNLHSTSQPFRSKDEAIGQLFAHEAAAAVRHAQPHSSRRENSSTMSIVPSSREA